MDCEILEDGDRYRLELGSYVPSSLLVGVVQVRQQLAHQLNRLLLGWMAVDLADSLKHRTFGKEELQQWYATPLEQHPQKHGYS